MKIIHFVMCTVCYKKNDEKGSIYVQVMEEIRKSIYECI
jgi:hypothetical protein